MFMWGHIHKYKFWFQKTQHQASYTDMNAVSDVILRQVAHILSVRAESLGFPIHRTTPY